MEERNQRKAREESAFKKIDFTKPIDKSLYPQTDGDCFGKIWDAGTQECGMCHDKEVCSILTKDKVDKKAVDLEEKTGTKYLDTVSFDFLTEENVRKFVKSGETTAKEMFSWIMKEARTSDKVSVKAQMIRFIKGHNFIYTKDSIVWIR